MTESHANDVPALIRRWVDAGIITPEQGERIRADHATLVPRRPVSLAAEGLGYLGGVIVLVGLGLVLRLSWDSLGAGGRIGIVAGAAAALLAAGAVVPAAQLGATGARLRGVLWVAGTALVFPGLELVGENWLRWRDDPSQVTTLAAAGTAAVAVAVWALHRHVLQHIGAMAALTTAAVSGTHTAGEPSFPAQDLFLMQGLAVWGVGVVWFGLSVASVLPQRAGLVLGALGAIAGSLMMMINEDWGPPFGLGTVAVLVLTGVTRGQLPLLAVGSVGTLIMLPFAVRRYLHGGPLATALALVATGAALVAVGVYTARRRQPVSHA